MLPAFAILLIFSCVAHWSILERNGQSSMKVYERARASLEHLIPRLPIIQSQVLLLFRFKVLLACLTVARQTLPENHFPLQLKIR
jgi:hypothetical protein